MPEMVVPRAPATKLARTAHDLSDVDPLAAGLAHWLDTVFRIPGTSLRFGLDGILGLLAPGVGDVATGGLSAYLFFVALRRGVPLAIIGRMAGNVLLDTLLGSVPLVGDVFDFVWKANARNLELIRKHADRASPAGVVDYLIVAALSLVVVVLLALPLAFAVALGWGVFSALAR